MNGSRIEVIHTSAKQKLRLLLAVAVLGLTIFLQLHEMNIIEDYRVIEEYLM